MKVQDIMRREVRFAGPLTDLATAGRRMAEIGCGFLPVVGGIESAVVGVVTDRDIAISLSIADRKPSEMLVGEVMSRDVHTCSPTQDLRAALRWMGSRKVRRLVVVDRQRLVGVLCLDDVAPAARPVWTENLDGPLFVDVAETLSAICEHPAPAMRT